MGLAHIASRPSPVATLDALVGALGLSQVDFVKANIEEYEAALIESRAPGAH